MGNHGGGGSVANKGRALADNAVNIGTQSLIINVYDLIHEKILRGNNDDEVRQIKTALDELKSRALAGTLATKP